MKTWLVRLSIASAFVLAISCGDDDGTPEGASGSAGEGGESASDAGRGGTPTGGVTGDAGAATAGGGADEGGSTGAPVGPMCDPPDPPSVGAGGAGSGGSSGELAIIGEYVDDFGAYTVTSSEWTSGPAVFHISAFDNDEQWVVAQNDQENTFGACLWSRFDWAYSGSKLYYCQTAYDAADEDTARRADESDATNPAENGCGAGDFPWTELTEK